jgi:hypothetical protein
VVSSIKQLATDTKIKSKYYASYYGGVEGFNQVIDLLMDACEGLLKHITQK